MEKPQSDVNLRLFRSYSIAFTFTVWIIFACKAQERLLVSLIINYCSGVGNKKISLNKDGQRVLRSGAGVIMRRSP
jgi:hypothetical protein